MNRLPLYQINWQQPLTDLPASFYQQIAVQPLQQAFVIHANGDAARLLGVSASGFIGQTLLDIANGKLLPGMQTVATVYGGHQFGIYTSQLGDGRALSLGEAHCRNGQRFDIQLKGAGLTAYSRTLDGRLPLASAIYEYLGGEALAGLGIASTRSLALVGSKTTLQRDENQSAAIMMRMARSHLRFGHIEYFHHRDQFDEVKKMVGYVVEQHYPELLTFNEAERPSRVLTLIVRQTAELVAHWQSEGFTHGVMNTDNMTLTGETLDLGSYGFMERFTQDYSPNPNDDQHRYQFDQQPEIGRWNCLALAEAFSSLLPNKTIPARLLRIYRQHYQQAYLQRMRSKLGLYLQHPDDAGLIKNGLATLQLCGIDYPLFFRRLATFQAGARNNYLFELSQQPEPLRQWLQQYQQRLAQEMVAADIRRKRMLQINPAYVLRKHLVDNVCQRAVQGDYEELVRVMALLKSPYEEVAGMEAYAMPAEVQKPSLQRVS